MHHTYYLIGWFYLESPLPLKLALKQQHSIQRVKLLRNRMTQQVPQQFLLAKFQNFVFKFILDQLTIFISSWKIFSKRIFFLRRIRSSINPLYTNKSANDITRTPTPQSFITLQKRKTKKKGGRHRHPLDMFHDQAYNSF